MSWKIVSCWRTTTWRYEPPASTRTKTGFRAPVGNTNAAWERHANIYLQAGDAPNFIRSMLNQYAVDILPLEGYQFREHTTAGPHDKVFEEACFLERLRMMLVQEDGDTLWLARATPRVWLENGKRISVQNAPTHFGDVGYEIHFRRQRGPDYGHGESSLAPSAPRGSPPVAASRFIPHPRRHR